MSPTKNIETLSARERRWVERARSAQSRAYAPYSQYAVGCLLVDTGGKLHTGCNVENASYSAVICAERVAATKMVTRGAREIAVVVLITLSDEPVFPCGVCLQVLLEFGARCQIIAVNRDASRYRAASLAELYPNGFARQHLA
jgi:cytidine deaminase